MTEQLMEYDLEMKKVKVELKGKEGEVENLLLGVEKLGGENSALRREVYKCEKDKLDLKERVGVVRREMKANEKQVRRSEGRLERSESKSNIPPTHITNNLPFVASPHRSCRRGLGLWGSRL